MEAKSPSKQLVDEVLARVGEYKRQAVGGAYIVAPGRRFADEQTDEEVALLLRAHPITNIRWVIGAAALLVFPQIFLWTGGFGLIPPGMVFIARLLVYLLVMGYVLENFLHWYYSVLIVTNERIVDIDFRGLLYRSVAYASLNKIEQPSLFSGGLIRTFFRFGNVEIATAATEVQVRIQDVPYPDRVLKVIAQLSEELEKKRERGE